jgi:hypothetical protein
LAGLWRKGRLKGSRESEDDGGGDLWLARVVVALMKMRRNGGDGDGRREVKSGKREDGELKWQGVLCSVLGEQPPRTPGDDDFVSKKKKTEVGAAASFDQEEEWWLLYRWV